MRQLGTKGRVSEHKENIWMKSTCRVVSVALTTVYILSLMLKHSLPLTIITKNHIREVGRVKSNELKEVEGCHPVLATTFHYPPD